MSEHDSTSAFIEKKENILPSPEQEATHFIELFFMPSVEDRKWAKIKIPSAKLHDAVSYKDAVYAALAFVNKLLEVIPSIYGTHPTLAMTHYQKVKQILTDKIK